MRTVYRAARAILSPTADKFVRAAFAKKTGPFVKEHLQKGARYMEYNAMVMARLLGRLRTQRGLSQEVLSGLAGIARSHLAMIENGAKRPTVETLWKLAGALDMRLSELVRMAEEEMGL